MPTRAKYTYQDYIAGVLSGEIVVGKLMRQSVDRFIRLCADPRYEFRSKEAERWIDFFFMLTHFEGAAAGTPFAPLPWQQYVLAYVFGLYVRETGLRLVTSVYLEISRKNGKTAFAGGICLGCLTIDGEASPEVDLASNSKEQSKIAYKFVSNFAKGLDSKQKIMIPYRDRVKLVPVPGVLHTFAADSSKLDGYNASCYLLDEYHAAKSSSLRDVLASSQGSRKQPLAFITTTAGFDKLGPCYKERTMCVEVLSGVKEDDHLAPFIYSLDPEDDWKDPAVWIKSNPSLGHTVSSDFIQNQIHQAINSPSKEVGVRTKTLNQWMETSDVWIPDHLILESTKDVKLEDYRGYTAFAGVDLSSTSDLTALCINIPTPDGFVFFFRNYLPEDSIKEGPNAEMYQEWRRRGLLTVTPGNVCDYDYILNDLMDIYKIVPIRAVSYDSWNATQFTINATARGLNMVPQSQTIGAFSIGTKELERLIKMGRVTFENNEIVRYTFRNVVLKRDHNGNEKPAKGINQDRKIDNVIACIESLIVAIKTKKYSNFV